MKTDSFRNAICVVTISMALVPTGALAGDWWIEGGPIVRGGMNVKVSGGSYVQNLARHAAPVSLREPGSVGNQNDYADRTYQDGYVKLDIATTDPNAVGGPGNTWNWGYDNTSQYDATASTLSFHQQGDPGYTTLSSRSVSGKDEMIAPGIQIKAGFPLRKWNRVSIDMAFGFQGVWGAESRMHMTSYRERISQLTVTDRYNVADTVDPVSGFPTPRTAPGGYSGAYDVPGPIIPNLPASRMTTQADLYTAQNRVSFHFETDAFELTISPRIRYAATRALSLHLNPSVGVGYIDVSANRSEVFTQTETDGSTTTLARWHDKTSESRFRFVAGITLGAELALGRGFYAGVFAGYEWMVGAVRFGIGPNSVSVDGSGFMAGVVVGKQF